MRSFTLLENNIVALPFTQELLQSLRLLATFHNPSFVLTMVNIHMFLLKYLMTFCVNNVIPSLAKCVSASCAVQCH
ncbi:unnamed protein product [Arctogadus glacialis]